MAIEASAASAMATPTPADFWVLKSQVDSMQMTINSLATQVLENVKQGVELRNLIREARDITEIVDKDAIEDLKNKLVKIEKQVTNMADSGARRADDSSDGSQEGTSNKAYRKLREPKPFNPNEKNPEARFKAWAFVFGGHADNLRPGMENFLEWAAKQSEEIEDSALKEYGDLEHEHFDPVKASQILYDELRGLCPEGEPQVMIKNTRDGKRGAEAWRRICQRYDPKGVLVAEGIMEHIQSIEWPESATGVSEMLEKVEGMCKEYTAITGKNYPEESLRGRIMAIMPDPYKAHVRNNLKAFRSYREIHDYLIEQVRLKTDEEARTKAVKAPKGKAKEAAAAMEEMQQKMEAMAAVMNQWGYGSGQQWDQQQEELNAMLSGKGGYGKGVAYGKGKDAASGRPDWNPWKGFGGAKGAASKGSGKGQEQVGKAGGKPGGIPSPLTLGWSKGGEKGVGKGGSEFPGYCGRCWAWGHKRANCPKRPWANALPEEGDDEQGEEEDMCCLCNPEGADDSESGINAVEDNGEYERHSMLIDSGSAASFLKRGACEHIPTVPANEDQLKKSWSNASGGAVRMTGTARVKFDTNEWMPKAVKLRRSDQVDKTIGSVSEFCDKGNTVVFTRSGGSILRDPNEELAKWIVGSASRSTPFRRERGTYTLDMWIKKPTKPNQERRQREKDQKEDAEAKRKPAAAMPQDERGDMELAAVPAEDWEAFRAKHIEDFARQRR